MKTVEHFLKPENCGVEIERKTITNIKYYVAMVVSIDLAGSKDGVADKLANLPAITIANDLLEKSLDQVLQEFKNLGGTDQVAKGSELVRRLLN